MFFISTRNSKVLCNFNDAMLNVIAKQQDGLFVPSFLAKMSIEKIINLSNQNYKNILIEVLSYISDNYINKETIEQLVDTALKDFGRGFGDNSVNKQEDQNDIIAIKNMEKNIKILNLTYGPTGCYKDYGYCVASSIVNYLSKQSGKPRVVIDISDETSGASTAWAIKDKEYIKGFILLQNEKNNSTKALISQACKTSKNIDVATVSTDHTFFDKIRYNIYKNTSLRDISNMTFINDLNLICIFAYLPFFFKAYSSCNNKPFCVSIPTNNISMGMSAFFAKKIGIPIKKIILATEKSNFLKNIQEKKIIENNLSAKFNTNIPSNLERLLFYLYNANQSSVKRTMQEIEGNRSYKISESLLKKFTEIFYIAQCNNQFSMQNTINSLVKEKELYAEKNFAIAKLGLDEANINIQNEISDYPVVILNTLDYRRNIDFINTSLGYNLEYVNNPWTDEDVKSFSYTEIATDISEILHYILDFFDKKK